MSLAVSRYVSQYYRNNSFGATETGRKGYDARSLVTADMQAIKTALKELRKYDYEEGDGEELCKQVQAFANTYNNFIDSAKSIDNDELDRYLLKVKKMTKEQQDKLKDIGITIQSNGKLKIDTDVLEKTSRNKVSKVFAQDAEYGINLESHIKRITTLIRQKDLGMVSQSKEKTDADADTQLAQQLAEVLEGSMIHYSV